MKSRLFHGLFLSAILMVSIGGNSNGQGLRVAYTDPGPVLAGMGIDTSDIDYLISLVDTANGRTSEYAALYLAERRVSDAAPIIKARYRSRIDKLPPPFDYALALYLLRDPEALYFVSELVDTSLAWTRRGELWYVSDVLEGITMLLKLGDYSRWPLVDSLYQQPELLPASGYLDILSAFAEKPELRESAYRRLTGFLNDPRYRFRLHVLVNLRNFMDIPETRSLYRSVALTDTADVVVDYAIKTLFVRYKDPDVVTICKEVLIARHDTAMFDIILSWLWNVIRTPAALAALEEVVDGLPEGDLRTKVSREIRFFRPKSPLPDTPLDQMLETLVSYKHDVANRQWLGDGGLVTELDNHLENAKKHFAKGDEKNTEQQVFKFQEKVDFWRKKTEEDEKSGKPRGKRFITIEGWKFLHYHAQYILERLPR